MPQIKAAKKALRSNARRRVVNDRWRVKFRASIRNLTEALKEKDAQALQEAFNTAQSMLDRAARRHILHPNTAARKKSRLQHLVSANQK